MNRPQFGAVVKVLQSAWPRADLPPETLEYYWEELKDFDGNVVLTVVRTLSREGRDFIPPAGLIFRKACELELDAPQWGEVLKVIRSYWRTGATHPLYGDFDTHREAGKRVLANAHPFVGEFIKHLGTTQVNDNIDDGNGEARLRTKWEQFVKDRIEQRLMKGLPTAGLAAVERANGGEPQQLGEVIQNLLPSGE